MYVYVSSPLVCTCYLHAEVNGIGDSSACASSLQSYEKIRKKHSSPGHSSGSEDGLKVRKNGLCHQLH